MFQLAEKQGKTIDYLLSGRERQIGAWESGQWPVFWRVRAALEADAIKKAK